MDICHSHDSYHMNVWDINRNMKYEYQGSRKIIYQYTLTIN